MSVSETKESDFRIGYLESNDPFALWSQGPP